MSMDAVLIALFGLFGLIITTLGGVMVAKITTAGKHAQAAARDSAVVVAEVRNGHKANLREEADERHVELMDAFRTNADQMVQLQSDQVSMRTEMHQMSLTDLELAKSLAHAHEAIIDLAMDNTKQFRLAAEERKHPEENGRHHV